MKTIKKILFPVDLLLPNEQIADYAATCAQSFGAELVVLYATPSLSEYSQYFSVPEFTRDMADEAQKAMEEFVTKTFSGASVKIETKIIEGYAADIITEFAEENDIDLIIMATHQRTDLGRFFLGSVTNRVIRESQVPVLTYRPVD